MYSGSWCLRFDVSLRHKVNREPLSAAERLPKATRFFARLRRRLRKGKWAKTHAKAPTSSSSASSSSSGGSSSSRSGGGGGAASEEQRQRSRRQHRGRDGAVVVAAQGSHGLAMDCGLCALKNVTVDRDINGNAAFDVALALQSELEAQELQSGASSGVRHFEVVVGNLSGKAIRAIARKNDYALYRLARSDGECGFARALVEHMCILARERLCGVIWRIGPGVDGVAASHGHWVCTSYIYGAGDCSKHRWVFMDSAGGSSRDMPLSELMAVLDGAEMEQKEFSAVIDLR